MSCCELCAWNLHRDESSDKSIITFIIFYIRGLPGRHFRILSPLPIYSWRLPLGAGLEGASEETRLLTIPILLSLAPDQPYSQPGRMGICLALPEHPYLRILSTKIRCFRRTRLSQRYFFAGNIIHKHATVSAPIKSFAHAPELLLASGVQNLDRDRKYNQTDGFAVDNNISFKHIRSYGGLVGVDELLVDIGMQK